MSTTLHNSSITTKERLRAEKSHELLANHKFCIETKDTHETVELPKKAINILMLYLSEMANGCDSTLVPTNAELTTQQAGKILGVSRPHIIKLLEENKIPFHKVGTHRRILQKDLMKYKNEIDKKRSSVLDKLTKQAQALDMGY